MVPGICKYSSIIYRLTQIYFDECLAPYHIGGGQQFFLLRIHDNPGINQYQLARKGHFDKGTTARAVKKLEEAGYINRIADKKDRRFTKLYVSEEGNILIKKIIEDVHAWYHILVRDFSEEECILVEKLMERIAENAHHYIISK